MKIKQIKKRIKYLNSELNHRDYYDGWSVEGMEKELKKLEKKLRELKNEKD
tara:strand:- start:1311 stop:1463 length:153 start_codon:yes stop_codon:yes gene_type:complete